MRYRREPPKSCARRRTASAKPARSWRAVLEERFGAEARASQRARNQAAIALLDEWFAAGDVEGEATDPVDSLAVLEMDRVGSELNVRPRGRVAADEIME